jgi:hypothetical protein
MPLHRFFRFVDAFVACAGVALVLAASSPAVPADNLRPGSTASPGTTQTVVRENLVRTGDGPGTVGFIAIGAGAAAALLGAGYLGARIATRSAGMRSS